MSGMWDQEFRALRDDIKQLMKQASSSSDPQEFATVVDLRAGVEERVGAFTVAHDRINQVLRKKWAVSRANMATLYWSKQYLAKMKLLLDEFLALQNRKMWLRLLQVRFSGAVGSEKSNLEARHLVDLVLRRQQLMKVEQALRDDLDAVGGQRQKLREDYEKISSADENWLASVSMHGRLGVDPVHATHNPSTKALKELLKVVAVPLRHPLAEAQLAQASRDIDAKSDSLLEQCKLLAASYVQKGKESYDSNSLNKFKNAINQVQDLNVELIKKIDKLLSDRFEPARPKMVQSAAKQAKTEDRSIN